MVKTFFVKDIYETKNKIKESTDILKISMFCLNVPLICFLVLNYGFNKSISYTCLLWIALSLIISLFLAFMNGGIFYYGLSDPKEFCETKKVIYKSIKGTLANSNLHVVTLYLDGMQTPFDILYDTSSGKLIEDVEIKGKISSNRFINVISHYTCTVV